MNRPAKGGLRVLHNVNEQGSLLATEQEVTVLEKELRRVGSRLQSSQTLNHPRIRTALTLFDKQVANALGQSRGRHRMSVGQTAEE
jgi:hypothetical protein